MATALKDCFAYHRAIGKPAAVAVALARQDVAAGKDRYKRFDGYNRPSEDGTRWIESLEGCGLRLVDYADKIVRLDHTGWYADAFQDSTYRGVVLQLPSRDGRPAYVSAYEDPNNKGSYRADFGRGCLTLGERGGQTGNDCPSVRDAARAADSFAEKEAESAREYDETWQQGAKFADMKADESLNRKCVIELCAEIRQARRNGAKAGAAIRSTLRDKVESLLESIRDSREKRAEMVGNVWRDYRSAFNEGASETVFEGV